MRPQSFSDVFLLEQTITSSISITLTPPSPPKKTHHHDDFSNNKNDFGPPSSKDLTFLMRFMDPVLNSEGFCPGIPKPNLGVWAGDKRPRGVFFTPVFSMFFLVKKTFWINQRTWRSYGKKLGKNKQFEPDYWERSFFHLPAYQMMWTSIFFEASKLWNSIATWGMASCCLVSP